MKKYLKSKDVETAFINTFSNKQKNLFFEYYQVKGLLQKGAGITEISKKTNNTISKVNSWKRGKKPTSLKCFNRGKKRGYFKRLSKKTQQHLAYLLGYNFGDGNIHRNLCNTWFYGTSEDLPKINKLLKEFKIQGKIYVYKINNGKMCISDNAFTRFMVSLGAPIGDKTKQKFLIPDWIFLSKRKSKLKKKFLQGLFDSELSNVTLIKKKLLAFQTLKFYSVKEKSFVKDGLAYLEQIKTILYEFGISTSKARTDRVYLRSRDNGKMVELFFCVHSNYINLNNFITEIGFLYNSKRKKDSLLALKKIKKLAKKEKEKIIKYKKAIKLRKKGMSGYKIAKQINIPISDMKNWLYKGHKPRLYDFIENSQ